MWDGPKQQLINGVAGTGKTVLIQHIVLELDRRLPPEELIAVIMTKIVLHWLLNENFTCQVLQSLEPSQH